MYCDDRGDLIITRNEFMALWGKPGLALFGDRGVYSVKSCLGQISDENRCVLCLAVIVGDKKRFCSPDCTNVYNNKTNLTELSLDISLTYKQLLSLWDVSHRSHSTLWVALMTVLEDSFSIKREQVGSKA